jgi:hypothetical protein
MDLITTDRPAARLTGGHHLIPDERGDRRRRSSTGSESTFSTIATAMPAAFAAASTSRCNRLFATINLGSSGSASEVGTAGLTRF